MASFDCIEKLEKEVYISSGLLYRGKIKLALTSITPLTVLSGSLDMDQENNAIFKCISRFDKKVIIPGSTMKGMVRTIAECISHSCMLINDSKKDICGECIVCKTFGYLGYKSKVRFSDLINQDENYKTRIVNVPQLFKPVEIDGIKIYRHDTPKSQDIDSIHIEVVNENSKFLGDVYFEDIDKTQLSMLLYSLGTTGEFYHKIGYNKPNYFGSCKIDVVDFVCKDDMLDLGGALELAKNYGKGIKEIEDAKDKLCSTLDNRGRECG